MNRFFSGYKPEKRVKVEASELYQAAFKNKDAVKAQEIASGILHGDYDRRIPPLLRGWNDDSN